MSSYRCCCQEVQHQAKQRDTPQLPAVNPRGVFEPEWAWVPKCLTSRLNKEKLEAFPGVADPCAAVCLLAPPVRVAPHQNPRLALHETFLSSLLLGEGHFNPSTPRPRLCRTVDYHLISRISLFSLLVTGRISLVLMPLTNGDIDTSTAHLLPGNQAMDFSKALETLEKEYSGRDGLDAKTLLDSKINGGLTYNDFLILPGFIGMSHTRDPH